MSNTSVLAGSVRRSATLQGRSNLLRVAHALAIAVAIDRDHDADAAASSIDRRDHGEIAPARRQRRAEVVRLPNISSTVGGAARTPAMSGTRKRLAFLTTRW